jgi:streptogramin lyase
MLKNFFVVLYVIFISIVLTPWVHAYSYFWTVYGKEDGLPSSNVTTIAIDSGGYVWIGTQGNGTDLQGGVSIIDRMYEFISPYNTSDGLCSNVVKGIAFENVSEENHDNLDYGSIWIATNKGISVLDRKGVFTTISSRNSPLPGDNITTIFINKENTKWVSVWGKGVCCVDADFNWGKYTTTDGLCSSYILSIKEDRNGNIWFGSKERGVSYLDRDGNWIHFSSENSGLIGDEVRKIVEESPNKLWFVTPDGISVFDGQNWMSYTSRNSPLGSFVPTTMVVDRSGNKWIGTEYGGVFKLDSFGMWTQFHKDNTSLPDNMIHALVVDNRGTIWIATSSGLCSLGNFPQRPQYVLPHKEFQKPASPGLGKGIYHPFEHAVMWENIGESELNPELSFSLPTFFYGGRSWFYAALWADQDFSFKDLQYSIVGDRRGNLRMMFNGYFSHSHMIFLTCGGILSSYRDITIDKKTKYPFPSSYPEELEEYLMPGDQILSNDPEIQSIAHSLVQINSRGDMYKTVHDIVYSKFIQHMGLEEKKIGLLTEKEPGEERSKISSVKDIYYVLKNRKGDRHSKARLICTLARAARIPARIVMSMGGSVWSQVWISGLGWISVEVSHPVFDYVRPMRTYIPKLFSPAEHAISSVSGRDDDVGRVLWNPQIKAYYVESSPSELKNYSQISIAKILLTKIVSEGKVPDNARIQIGEDIFVVARQREGNVLLVFQDRTGREIKNIPLVFGGLSSTVNVRDRVFWRFIPRRIGEILVIENLQCETYRETPQKGMPAEKEVQGKKLVIQ